MKLKFKVQPYQTEAVDAVIDCFEGQPRHKGVRYTVDPGEVTGTRQAEFDLEGRSDSGLRNHEITIPKATLLENIRTVQRQRGIKPSDGLVDSAAAPGAPNLDIEMETGTGKTYVYTKTILEMHERYGWSKFIVVVPSIAIREGVKKSFDVTAQHFREQYGIAPRTFIYDSSQLEEIERFSSNIGPQVMIINVQAFNRATQAEANEAAGKKVGAKSAQNLRIFRKLDDFQSRKPIDIIAANRPIVIIDEPQKFGTTKTLKALNRFNPLMVLRYSATHKVDHNKVHRLDAVDAYNKKLVKRITVRGITVKGLAGTDAYLYLDEIRVGKGAPQARIEIETQNTTGTIRRKMVTAGKGDNLYDLSGGLEAYRGLFITDIRANDDAIDLSSGDTVHTGQLADTDAVEEAKRRIQIREVIDAHLKRERGLHAHGIKVLSLFFIDEVAKYRDYDREDTLGDYARVFEEEYQLAVDEVLGELPIDEATRAWHDYLRRDDVGAVHEGYFSIDKKTKHLVDPSVKKTGDDKGHSDDVSAYDLILKDKERLLSLDEPVRFIFSHSALREGWDNPNVFVMGMLKKSDSTISRRQEIGRGLRICVNQHGERQDDPTTVHDINVLTVVTDESYTEFVDGLQKEIAETLSARPTKATADFFAGQKLIDATTGQSLEITEAQAKLLVRWLQKHDFVDLDDHLSDAWHDLESDDMPDLPEELQAFHLQVVELIEALDTGIPLPENDRKLEPLPLNKANFERTEFQELWNRINHKAVYKVAFYSDELIDKAVTALDAHLHVATLQYIVESGVQAAELAPADLGKKTGFTDKTSTLQDETVTAASQVRYDLIGEIAGQAGLTRRTVCTILQRIQRGTFAKYRKNPEQFIAEASRLITEQKGTVTVDHLAYDLLDDTYDSSIFTENQTNQDLAALGAKLTKHVYDYAVTDSKVERAFVEELDSSTDVVVYAKLPRGFKIPTPVGDYNPDWAIAFEKGKVKHVYFVAETKGSLSTLQLKGAEEAKIASARRFFDALEARGNDVTYDVVTDYGQLLSLVA